MQIKDYIQTSLKFARENRKTVPWLLHPSSRSFPGSSLSAWFPKVGDTVWFPAVACAVLVPDVEATGWFPEVEATACKLQF